MRRIHHLTVALVGSLALAGCGNKADPPAKTKPADDAAVGSAAAPLAMPALGVDQIKRFNFPYEAGAPAHDKAVAAYRKRDWPAVRTHAEAALAKDAMHLGAHRLLAAALAQLGEPAAAVEHLTIALAADEGLYARTLGDDDLKGFFATAHGQAVKALDARIREEYARRTASALWLVGRRSPFKPPKELGVQPATTRGELYAFDRETRRYLRLTHTDHQVAGFVRAGAEVAILGFDRIDRPKPAAKTDPETKREPKPDPEPKPEAKADAKPDAKTDAKPDAKPDAAKASRGDASLLARPWIQLLDTATWQPTTPRITLPAAREVMLGYGAGDQLLVATVQATGRWTVSEPVVSSVDRSTGKLTRVTAAVPPTHLTLSLDEGHLVRVPDGVIAAWTGTPPVSATLAVHPAVGPDKAIQLPESGQVAQAQVAVAPDGAHVAFATTADPCAKDAAPSLYVADARTGAYKHLLSARSRFATRWLDATVLAYEDGDGAIRLWDAASSREVMRLENRPGIALDVLSLEPAPLCKQAPPAVDAAGTSDEALPPEEPAAGAGQPVTAPVTVPP